MLISYYFCTAYSLSVFTLPKCVLLLFYFRQLAFELCKRLLTKCREDFKFSPNKLPSPKRFRVTFTANVRFKLTIS